MSKTIQITAKCSDMFHAQLRDEKGKFIGWYDGYVPSWFGNSRDGDYVLLTIEIESGKILGWRKPSAKDLSIFEP